MRTRMLARLAVSLAVVLLLALCATEAAGAAKTHRVFEAGYEDTWQVALQALTTDLKMSIKTLEKSSGLIQVDTQGAGGSEWGDANELVKEYTTKKVKALSLWSGFILECNLLFEKKSADETGVTVNTAIRGFAGWKEEWVQLESNGRIEGLIFEAIQNKLDAQLARADPASAAGATKAVAAATEAADHGTIELLSSPERADVEVDGKFVGQTPATLRLSPGKHEIKVKKAGYRAWVRELHVLSGSSLHLEAALEE